ncbi:MAG: hypothetical protein KDD31_05685 [Muricauda sp.]|nr:hypothetical protein [Allomuricauda sp.]
MYKLLFPIIAFLLLSYNPSSDKSQLYGKWKGEDQGEIGYINFDPDGYAHFEIRGQIFGGKEFEYDGKMGTVTYKVSENVKPIQVDLILTILDTGEENRLLCIAEFLDENTMKFAINFQNQRPTAFTEENSLVFTRQ